MQSRFRAIYLGLSVFLLGSIIVTELRAGVGAMIREGFEVTGKLLRNDGVRPPNMPSVVLGEGQHVVVPHVVIRGTARSRGRSLVRPDQLGGLFRFAYNEAGDLGAKAVSYRDHLGKIRMVFFSAKGTRGEVHHPDALAWLLRMAAATDLRRAGHLRTMARDPRALRGDILSQAQGFQFTMRNKLITRFDIDSGVTGAQIRHRVSLRPDDVSDHVEAVMEALPEEAWGFDRIGVLGGFPELISPRVDRIQGYPLEYIQAP